MFLDLPTLYAQLLAMQLLFAVVHAMVWRTHPREKTLLFWAFANAVGALTALIVLVEPPEVVGNPSFSAAVVGNVGFLLANVAQWSGVRHLLGKPLRPWRSFVVLGAPTVCLLILYAENGPLWAREALVSMVVAILAGMQLRDLLHAPKIMGIALLRGATILHLGFYAFRVFMILRHQPTAEAHLAAMSLAGWSLFEALVVLMMANMSYLMVLSERQKRMLNNLAFTDPLTGLLNRRAFAERCADIADRGGAVLMLDIDQFKAVNDTHGHAAGDAVLVAMAQLLRLHVRTDDIVARTGGEEFSVVLPGSSLEAASAIAERIRVACADLAFAGGLQVTVSVGLTRLAPDEPMAAASARADRALYDAKRRGRNCVALAAA